MFAHDRYLASLEQCKHIARDEFGVVASYFKLCDAAMQRLQQTYVQVVKSFSGHANSSVREELRRLQASLEIEYARLQAMRSHSLSEKRKQFEYFNVMLFGRTMTGKSTIREAITGGDGATIGKGAQRTTRNVREYRWSNLQIVDTPGFGAFGGHEDAQLAREVLERVDIVLFMLNSDSIQETTFDELEHVRKLNKPAMFVLNVKKDLENEGNRRRALKDPAKYVYKEEDIRGHVERLKQLAQNAGMNSSHVRVIPIHAQAAFLSTIASDDERDRLRELSRLDGLLRELCTDVEIHGPVRRIQSFLDAALHHIDRQLELLIQQGDEIRKLRPLYEAGKGRISAWRKKLERDIPWLVKSEVNAVYKPLVDSVADFVDDYIESSDVQQHWKRHCAKWPIQKTLECRAHGLAEQLADELAEFGKEVQESISIHIRFDAPGNPQAFDAWDYKRIGGWGSAIAGVVSSIAFFNSWNPAGWVAFGAMALFSVFSWFSDSRSSKLRAAKQRAREQLLEGIECKKKETRAAFLAWVEKSLIGDMIVGAERRLGTFSTGLESFESALGEARTRLAELEREINERLLHRVAYLLSGRYRALPPLGKVVRAPGYACYALTKDGFRDVSLSKRIGDVLKERIEIVRDGPNERVLEQLFGRLVQSVEMRSEREAVLYAFSKDLPKIFGKQHRRIKLAAALTGCEIHTKDLEASHA